jgi:hypothetical protein
VKQVAGLLNLRKFYRPMYERMLAAWPDGLRQRLIDYHLDHWGKTLEESRNLQGAVTAEITGGDPMPDTPVIVLTAMGIDPFQAVLLPTPYLHELNLAKLAFYTAFAASLPRGENRAIEDAGHSTLHTDRPDAVVTAIRDVVAAARVSAAAGARNRSVAA